MLAAGGLAWAAPPAAGFTVLTWNVENYVAEDRMVEGAYRRQYPKSERAKAALRTTLRALQPDLLALQEMGPEPYLEELQRDLATEGLVLPYRALLAGPDEARHVAVLSRVPLTRVVSHAAVPFRARDQTLLVRRGLLEVAVDLPGGAVTLFVFHLKSRHTESGDDPNAAAQRAGEAEAVRDLVLQRFPDPAAARFLMVGDCNDGPRSRPLQALAQRGRTAIATILPATDGRGDAWTYAYRKAEEFTRVDYALVSPGLWAAVVGACGEIPDTPEVRAASDHRPVLVRLREGAAGK